MEGDLLLAAARGSLWRNDLGRSPITLIMLALFVLVLLHLVHMSNYMRNGCGGGGGRRGEEGGKTNLVLSLLTAKVGARSVLGI